MAKWIYLILQIVYKLFAMLLKHVNQILEFINILT